MNITISAIKADVGSIGGHTRPTPLMVEAIQTAVKQAIKDTLILDGTVTFTGDDIAITMSHTHGSNAPKIHTFAWNCFKLATAQAQKEGCYAAGQDLLTDAPSTNIRGAGPGVSEITFDYNSDNLRPAETFMVITADKCGPGAFNLPLFLAFADPMYCAGLMLPKMIQGFSFEIVDMNHAHQDKTIQLKAPQDYYKITALLRDNDRFGIKAIVSQTYPDQIAVSTSTDRLHTIAGTYTGKDDPIAIVRTQGIFPAPEEILMPFAHAAYVGGGARGSHVMPLMPMPINSTVTGYYCLPIVSCVGYSLKSDGTFSQNAIDFFNNNAWDHVRIKAQEKALSLRAQGWSGPAMLSYSELEYGGFRDTVESLLIQFSIHKKR